MKVKINSSYGKKLKYKIYDYDGERRKLLSKGKFLNSAEMEIFPENREIIVRIKRRCLFFALFSAVYAIILNLAESGSRGGYVPRRETGLYPFEEIIIKDISRAPCIEVQYEKSPMLKTKNTFDKNLKVNYLSCGSHPYMEELSGRSAVNVILYTFAVIFWVALICGICLLIRFLVLYL